MAVDYFNNSSNDYINPSLPVCPGVADGGGTFEFIPKRSLGVISGGDIMAAIDFTDFSQAVTGWTKERKTIQPGEVTFIQGLTKGLLYRTLVFTIDNADISSNDAGYYITVDMSIGYYKNFRYTTIDVSATGDYDNGIDIGNALDIALGDLAVGVNADSIVSIDASSYFSFSGDALGFNFEIPYLQYTLDGCTHILSSDANRNVLSAKYPNTGMLGYTLKLIYPSVATDDSDHYINLKHAPTTFSYFDVSTGDASIYVNYIKQVDAGNNTSSDTVMSAGEFLNYVDTNELWEKVGQLKVWLSAVDTDENSNIANLLTGFYLFNPQAFPVMVEYMVIL